MLSKRTFLIVGFLNIDNKVVYSVIKEKFAAIRCVFVSKEGYLKSRFDYANATGRKIEAIFVGPVPHRTFAAGKGTSMVSLVNVANSITPVYVCRNKSGTLKFTKTSVRAAVKSHLEYLEVLDQKRLSTHTQTQDLIDLTDEIFPNDSLS